MNISQLAQHLGVAVSTVSRVLSGNAEKYRISEQTVKRVQEAAKQFHVAPDPLGAGLRKGRLGMIGLVVPDITNPFFSQLARAIELKLRSSGVAVQLCDTAEDSETELSLLGNLLSRRLDGIIVAPVGEASVSFRDLIENATVPVVLMDRLLPGLDLPSVSLDNRAAGRLAARHLLERGHRRLGCLRGDPGSIADQERCDGVRQALADSGLDPNSLRSAGSGYAREDSLSGARDLLDSSDRPSGIITLSGQGILGILEVARNLDLRIPDSLSVVAFDDQPWSALVEPPLTTVTQPVEPMASKAVELLTGSADRRKNATHVFEASLLDRASVVAIAEAD